MRKVSAVLGVAVLAGLLWSGKAVRAAAEEPKPCGYEVFASFRLQNNLVECPNHGLVVKASNITIDLGGQRLTRLGACCTTLGNGIHNSGFHNVVVKNGDLRGFTNGVFYENANGGKISSLQVVASGNGIKISGDSAKNVIKKNKVFNSGFSGISVVAVGLDGPSRTVISSNELSENARGLELIGAFKGSATDNTISSSQGLGAYIGSSSGVAFTSNTVEGNGGGGVKIDDSVQMKVNGNTVTRNAYSVANASGIALEDSTGALVRNNAVIDNEGHGISLLNASDNRLERNKVKDSDYSGIAILASSNRNRVVGNTSNANSLSGISVDNGTSGNKILENTANSNRLHGIESYSLGKIARNVVKKNGFSGAGGADEIGLGITAPDGTPGSDNLARGNDDDRQCVPAYLCR